MAGELDFTISLDDHLSGPARKAARAVDELSNDFKNAKSQLAFFQGQLSLAKNLGNIEGYTKFSAAVAKSRQEVFELGSALGQAPAKAETLFKIKDPAEIARHALEGVTTGVREMAAAISGGDAKGAVQGVTEALAGMASLLDLVVPGLGQAAAAAVKVGGAFAAMTVGLIQGGVELALEVTAVNKKLEAMFDAFGHGPEAGRATLDLVDDMAKSLPQSRDELAQWTVELQKMGVTDLGKVRTELLAMASAQALSITGYDKIQRKIQDAVQGQHKLTIAGKELTKTIGDNVASTAAAKMGMSLGDLEKKLKAGTVDAGKFGNALEEALIEKGAGPLQAMWGKTSVITDKLKKSFGELFADVDTSPLTDAMRNLLVLFDQGKPSGQALKASITDAFNGIVKAIGWAITEGEVLFLEMEVGALTAELELRVLLGTIEKVASALAGVGSALGVLPDLSSLFGASEAPGSQPVGQGIGEGMVAGMQDQLGAVHAAGMALGEAAAQGAREGAQVHSPSRLTMEIGNYMAEGLALGITQSPAPEQAGRTLSGNALGGMVGSALTSPPANENGKGAGVTISGLVINITAPEGVTEVNDLSATGLVLALERLQLAGGR
jgi:hypothetical protein